MSTPKGLNKTFHDMAQTALRIFDDVAVTVEFRETNVSGYDPETDSIVENVTTHNVRGILTGITDKEKTKIYPKTPTTAAEHRKLIIATKDFPTDFRPMLEDYVYIDGEKWQIKQIKGVPGDAIYTLVIERAV